MTKPMMDGRRPSLERRPSLLQKAQEKFSADTPAWVIQLQNHFDVRLREAHESLQKKVDANIRSIVEDNMEKVDNRARQTQRDVGNMSRKLEAFISVKQKRSGHNSRNGPQRSQPAPLTTHLDDEDDQQIYINRNSLESSEEHHIGRLVRPTGRTYQDGRTSVVPEFSFEEVPEDSVANGRPQLLSAPPTVSGDTEPPSDDCTPISKRVGRPQLKAGEFRNLDEVSMQAQCSFDGKSGAKQKAKEGTVSRVDDTNGTCNMAKFYKMLSTPTDGSRSPTRPKADQETEVNANGVHVSPLAIAIQLTYSDGDESLPLGQSQLSDNEFSSPSEKRRTSAESGDMRLTAVDTAGGYCTTPSSPGGSPSSRVGRIASAAASAALGTMKIGSRGSNTRTSSERVGRRGSVLDEDGKKKQIKTYKEQEDERKRKASTVRNINSMEMDHDEDEEHHDQVGHRCHQVLHKWVTSSGFDYFFALLIVLNALYIGLQVELKAHQVAPQPGETPSRRGAEHEIVDLVQYGFAFAFFCELVIRIAALRIKFFYNEDAAWNCVDFIIVSLSVIEVVMEFLLTTSNAPTNMSVLRLVRFVRIIRILRIIRIMRFFRSLRILIVSIFSTLKSLVWAMLLLIIIMYLFAILFTQAAVDFLAEAGDGANDADDQLMRKYFGTVPRSVATLFMTISGGMNWEAVSNGLSTIGWVYVVLFVMYVAFASFAVLNVVTGVFCQGAIETAQFDQDEVILEQMLSIDKYTEQLRALFMDIDSNHAGSITLSDFEGFMQDPGVQAYFQALELQVHEAWSLFKLIDTEGTNELNITDFVEGCLRMRGTAKSLEVNEMLYQNRWMMDRMVDFMQGIEEVTEMMITLPLSNGYAGGMSPTESSAPSLSPLTPGSASAHFPFAVRGFGGKEMAHTATLKLPRGVSRTTSSSTRRSSRHGGDGAASHLATPASPTFITELGGQRRQNERKATRKPTFSGAKAAMAAAVAAAANAAAMANQGADDEDSQDECEHTNL